MALNSIAEKSRDAIYVEMESKLDRPTPFTMKSLRIDYASRKKQTTLQAAILVKDKDLAKSKSLAESIGHEFTGGGRIRKRLEYALTHAGLISSNEFVAPGVGAKLDKYGNISNGQVIQILSQLKAGIDPYSHSSNSKRSLASRKRAGEMFWSRGSKLPRGVWMRNGRNVKPILLVVGKPSYKQRIDINRITKRIVDAKLDQEFRKALDFAIRTARY